MTSAPTAAIEDDLEAARLAKMRESERERYAKMRERDRERYAKTARRNASTSASGAPRTATSCARGTASAAPSAARSGASTGASTTPRTARSCARRTARSCASTAPRTARSNKTPGTSPSKFSYGLGRDTIATQSRGSAPGRPLHWPEPIAEVWRRCIAYSAVRWLLRGRTCCTTMRRGATEAVQSDLAWGGRRTTGETAVAHPEPVVAPSMSGHAVWHN